ncbi:MAG: S1 RNA-binding domain-containing protein [Chloroflexi bacterium]|nr:S1 RNA-binding domain-containing protein [Chloroflexota bacterium]
MIQEERGKDEELTSDSPSAELSPTEAAGVADPLEVASDHDAASEALETGAPAETENGARAEEPPADVSAADEIVAAEESASVAAQAPSADDADESEAPAVSDPAEDEVEPPETSAPEVTAAAEETEAAPAADEKKATKAQQPPEAESRFKRGEIHQGVISGTKPTAVTIDLGEGDEGIVPGRELELMTRKMLESLVVGAEVDVYVVNPRNHRGETVLSINHALEEIDWRNAEDYAKSKEVYEALIGGYNKGGLIVRFGRLRGFVPQSQLAEERARSMSGATPEERYGPMVNQPIGVKVMEVDRHRNRLILSERAALREVRQARKEALIAELQVGDVKKGVVVSLENFGAFVDIGGGEGLVHLSELAWGHITHPRQAVNIGDEVEVEVISINPEAKRIGLSRRRVISDPWDEVATALRRGQLVRGRVTKLTKFGAFARLIDHDAVEGLIHISELSGDRVTHPREVVKRGDELVLRIVKIDIKDRRLGLSLKSVNSTEYLDLDWEMAIQESTSLQADATEGKEQPVKIEAEDEAARTEPDEPDAQAEAKD